jgi:hypothetical protein
MSTILKALRRLELEKSVQDGRPLKDEVTSGPDTGSRRGFPLLWTMLAAGALGLGLGSSVLWLWPRETAGPAVAEAAPPASPALTPAPPAAAVAAAPVIPAPEVMAPPPVPMIPEPAVSLPAGAEAEPEPPVASAPPAAKPAAAFSSPVEVVSRPAPVRAVPEPEPEPAAEPKPAPRGSEPPFARSRRASASAPATDYVQPPLERRPGEQTLARIEKPVLGAARAPAPEPAAPAGPNLLVSSTVWHPQHDRRSAMVSLEGLPARELREGDSIGSLVVSEIGPSSVTFLNDGAPLKRRVGARD